MAPREPLIRAMLATRAPRSRREPGWGYWLTPDRACVPVSAVAAAGRATEERGSWGWRASDVGGAWASGVQAETLPKGVHRPSSRGSLPGPPGGEPLVEGSTPSERGFDRPSARARRVSSRRGCVSGRGRKLQTAKWLPRASRRRGYTSACRGSTSSLAAHPRAPDRHGHRVVVAGWHPMGHACSSAQSWQRDERRRSEVAGGASDVGGAWAFAVPTPPTRQMPTRADVEPGETLSRPDLETGSHRPERTPTRPDFDVAGHLPNPPGGPRPGGTPDPGDPGLGSRTLGSRTPGSRTWGEPDRWGALSLRLDAGPGRTQAPGPWPFVVAGRGSVCQAVRVWRIFQLLCQVLPLSVEKSCSQLDLSEPGVQTKRTSIG